VGNPAAKEGDAIVGAGDIHIVLVPNPGGPIPTPRSFPFNGRIRLNVSKNVRVNGQAAVTLGSMAQNALVHIPQPGPFQVPPMNLGRVMEGSLTVRINGKAAARKGDRCETCHDIPFAGPQAPEPVVAVEGESDVFIG
jgi:uncharacterized Zn-binding protein involved in type VI secretion